MNHHRARALRINHRTPEHRQSLADRLVDRAFAAVKENYVVVGRREIKPWQAWLLIGLAVGLVVAYALVANRSGEFAPGRAADDEEIVLSAAAAFLQPRQTPEGQKAGRLSADVIRLKDALGKTAAAAQGAVKAELRAVLAERRKTLEGLLSIDPAAALLAVLPQSVVGGLPPEVQADVEQAVSISGTVEVLHRDDPQISKSTFEYFLRVGNQRLKFYPVGRELAVRSGTRIRVDGYQIGGKVFAAAAGNTIQVLAQPPPESTGDQKTLAVLVNFLDSPPSPPFTLAQAGPLIFQDQAQAFFKETSYNQVSWSGDAIGWYTVPRNAVDPFGNVIWPQFIGDVYDPDGIAAYIKGQGIDLTQYGRLILLAHHPYLGGGMSGVGKWDIQWNGQVHRLSISWIGSLDYFNQPSFWGQHPFSWTNLDYILTHELGHALGVLHANSWECGQGVILTGPNCSHIEYGNRFDAMGSGYRALHFNAFMKELLGWGSRLLAITKSGTYTIGTLELSPGNAPLPPMAKILPQGYTFAPYYLEYRRAIGFDLNFNDPAITANQNGVFVNWMYDPLFFTSSRLLDISPTSSTDPGDWDQVVLLKRGQKLVDPASGVVIGPVVTNSPSSISLNVLMMPPRCIRANPDLTVYVSGSGGPRGFSPGPKQSPVDVIPGQSAWFSEYIQNLDSFICGPSDFKTTLSLPEGWSYVLYGLNPVSITPNGGTAYLSGEIKVSPAAIVGQQYQGALQVKNLASGRRTSFPLAFNVIPPPPPPMLDVALSQKGPPPQNIIAGSKNVTFALPIFDATHSSESVGLLSAQFRLETDIGSSMPMSCYLADGGIPVITGANIVNPLADGVYTFTVDQFVVIPAGTGGLKVLDLICDVPAGAVPGDTLEWRLNSLDVVQAFGVKTGQSAQVSITDSPDNQNRMTIGGAGTLSVVLDPSSPALALAQAGRAHTVAVFRLSASNEDVDVRQMAFKLSNTNQNWPQDLLNISLFDEKGNQLGIVVATSSDTGLIMQTSGLIVQPNIDRTVTLLALLADIGNNQPGHPGDQVTLDWDQVNINGLPASYGVGLISGQTIFAIGQDTQSEGVRMFRSFPGMKTVPVPSTSLADQTGKVLYRFEVGNQAGTFGTSHYKFTYNISTTSDDGTTTDFSISNLRQYAFTNSNFSGDAYGTNPINNGGLAGGIPEGGGVCSGGPQGTLTCSVDFAFYFNPTDLDSAP